jgi:hypothetical protein
VTLAGRAVMWSGSIGAAGVLALALVSCGGMNAQHHPQRRRPAVETSLPGPFATHGPMARIPPASPVAMTATRRSLLSVCRKNSLLRPICPRLVPAANQPHTTTRRLGYCYDRNGHDLLLGGHYALLASNRCGQAGWGYEAGALLPGYTSRTRLTLSGWEGRTWIPVAGESLLFSPPFHVHVEIAASTDSISEKTGLIGVGAGAWPGGAHRVTDALLSPKRTGAVSLGWVRWYGKYGQLVLAPVYPVGGEWGGHLIFYVPPNAHGVSYAITLHAWMPALRLTGHGVDRVFRLQRGPALPHVIATLKTIVGSALGQAA